MKSVISTGNTPDTSNQIQLNIIHLNLGSGSNRRVKMDVPAMVANPPVITACSSDLVIIGRYGLIISGASV